MTNTEWTTVSFNDEYRMKVKSGNYEGEKIKAMAEARGLPVKHDDILALLITDSPSQIIGNEDIVVLAEENVHFSVTSDTDYS